VAITRQGMAENKDTAETEGAVAELKEPR